VPRSGALGRRAPPACAPPGAVPGAGHRSGVPRSGALVFLSRNTSFKEMSAMAVEYGTPQFFVTFTGDHAL
jgi:hypothetical protein